MMIVDSDANLLHVREELARVTRLYTMLCQITRAIVRAEDPQNLFDAICRIAVKYGNFKLAWVGLSEPTRQRVTLVAHAGSASMILKMHLMATHAGTLRQSPASRAIADEQPCVINHLLSDTALQGMHRELLSHELHAAASFPIRLQGRVLGAFTVASMQAGFFTDKELGLLAEIADDVSFTLDVMHRDEQRSAAESKMQYLVNYDAQTGLPSRSSFESRITEASLRHTNMVVLAISLTRYHAVLQTLGQTIGVEVSSVLASRLEATLSSGFSARIAEAAFAVLLENEQDVGNAEEIATRIYQALSEGIWIDGQEVYLEPYIGIARYPDDGSAHILLNHALVAANFLPREAGRYVRSFSTEMEQGPKKRLNMEAALRKALKLKEFVLYYQPQVDLLTGRVIGAETLMRWNRPGHGMVSPLDFIPLLEETGMIWDAGEWAMHEACRVNRSWQDEGLPPIRIAVNLSARQFQSGDIQTMVRQALLESKLDPKWLELELTEGIVLLNTEAVIRTMQELRKDGVSHALDDFGTGYSSLSYLQRLPVERIKIDRSFVSNITTNPGNAAIARAVVGMAHSLKMSVIAEGVETEGQLGYLRGLGCEEMQGYYFSKPLPEQQFAELLRSERGISPAPDKSRPDHVLLLIGDDLTALNHIIPMIGQEGYQILSTTSVKQGLELLATNAVGVVVCDKRMQEMSGDEFLRKVEKMYPDIIRVVMASLVDMGDMLMVMNSGIAHKILGKPWNHEQASSCLRDAFRLFEVGRENRMLSSKIALYEGLLGTNR